MRDLRLLPPGSRLGAHRDPFAGSLRYHLRLITPNSPDCYIVVDGQKSENRTGITRVILFCDIERALSNPVLWWINRTIGRGMIRAAATQNVPGEHVGALNHIFSYVMEFARSACASRSGTSCSYYL